MLPALWPFGCLSLSKSPTALSLGILTCKRSDNNRTYFIGCHSPWLIVKVT